MISAQLPLIGILLALPISVTALDAGQPQSFQDPNTGLSFHVPADFVLTQYLDAPTLQPNIRALLPKVLVLIERRRNPTATPIVLGSVPSISIDVLTRERARFNQFFLTPQFKATIGGRKVYELPATNGPTTQQLFYYLVPLADGTLLEIAGHRYYFTRTDNSAAVNPTHYDAIIAQLLRSLTQPPSNRSSSPHQPTRHS